MKWRWKTNKELKESYRATFGPECGPRAHEVFIDLFDKCGMDKTNFVAGQPDMSAFNDGCRSIFLYILQMTYEPDVVLEKIKEIKEMEYIDE